MKAQIIAVVATWVLAFVGTTIILKVLDVTMGLRVSEEEEIQGLDLAQHSESAYALDLPAYGEYARVGGASLQQPVEKTRPRTTP